MRVFRNAGVSCALLISVIWGITEIRANPPERLLAQSDLTETEAAGESDSVGEEQQVEESAGNESLEGFESEGAGDESLEGFEAGDSSKEESGFEDFGSEGGAGFGDIAVDVNLGAAESDGWSWGGYVKEDWAYALQDSDPDFAFVRKDAGLAKTRSTLNLKLDLKLSSEWRATFSGTAFYDDYYRQQGREKYSEDLLNAYETEAEIRDAFMEGTLTEVLWIKTGRQIIGWGESEASQITDMANPRDNRELGQQDLEDIRVPVTATKLSLLLGGWEFNGVAVHEIRPNKNAPAGADYDLLITLRNPVTVNSVTVIPRIEEEEVPESNAENTEWLFRAFRPFNGGDLSFIYADVFDDDIYLDYESAAPAEGGVELTFVPRHKRIVVQGVSGNFVSGAWLFKFELARKIGKAFLKDFDALGAELLSGTGAPKSWSKKNSVQTMLGFDYTVITDLVLTLEGVHTQIQDYEDNLLFAESVQGYSLAIRYDLLAQTVHPQLFFIRLPGNEGDVARISVSYDWMDALQVSGGLVLYEASEIDQQVYPFRDNDRLLAGIKYSF